MKQILIIPAFNEAAMLPALIQEIREKIPEFDYIIINDGSTDDTESVCDHNELNVIHLISNLGIGGAVQAGYKYARQRGYDIAVQLDGDGQHDPASVRDLVVPIQNDQADLVIGSRFIDRQGFQTTLLRRAGIIWLNGVLRVITHQKITDSTSGLRAANRQLIQQFAASYPHDYPEPETICEVIRRRFRVIEVPVVMRERTAGKSSIRPFHSLYYMLKVTLAILVANIKKV
jgi:hypothetical protein